MDEPTTGLDPESRNNLWHVVKMAKTNRAIILTSKLFFHMITLSERTDLKHQYYFKLAHSQFFLPWNPTKCL